MQDFANFIHNNELMDVELKKLQFTWTNGRFGEANIYEKLDRVLISQDYLIKMGDSTLMGLPKNGSNQNPFLWETQDHRNHLNAPF